MNTLIFLRHGKTEYTQMFPDLTDEGKTQISRAADEIIAIIGERVDVEMISSVLPRAMGSADIIAKRIGYNPHGIGQEPAIRCMDFYDNEAAGSLWTSFGSARGVDCAYAHDDLFESGEVVERRSAIQQRFWTYLGTLFERFVDGTLPDVLIHTSHFEVLWQLAATLDGEEPLIHGEVIRMDLTPTMDNFIIRVEVSFRGRTKVLLCRTPSYLFAEQFS